MKLIPSLFLSFTLASHGETYWLLDKNTDGVGSNPKVTASNSTVFSINDSGVLVLLPQSTFATAGSLAGYQPLATNLTSWAGIAPATKADASTAVTLAGIQTITGQKTFLGIDVNSDLNVTGVINAAGSITAADVIYANNGISCPLNIVCSGFFVGNGSLLTNLPAAAITGTLAVANGGTGASTAATARAALGLGSIATLAAPSGTVVGTTDTQTLTNKSINAGQLTGTLAAANGGTGVSNTGTLTVSTNGVLTFATAGNTLTVPTGGGTAALRDVANTFTQANTISTATDSTTAVNSLTASTSTAATFGAQKWSPVIRQSANGWGTTAGTSQDVTFSTIVKPTQSTVPTGKWALQSSIAGGALTDRLTVDSAGAVETAGTVSAGIYYGASTSNGVLRMDSNDSARGLGIGSLNRIAWSSGAYSGGSVSGDTNLSRNAAGILQLGTTAANALGSLNLTNLTASGNVICSTVGNGLQVKGGSALARAGNATLVGGTVTVANTTVTANTVIILTRKTSGGTIGMAVTYTLSPLASFTINSDSAFDTSVYSFMLLEVNP